MTTPAVKDLVAALESIPEGAPAYPALELLRMGGVARRGEYGRPEKTRKLVADDFCGPAPAKER